MHSTHGWGQNSTISTPSPSTFARLCNEVREIVRASWRNLVVFAHPRLEISRAGADEINPTTAHCLRPLVTHLVQKSVEIRTQARHRPFLHRITSVHLSAYFFVSFFCMWRERAFMAGVPFHGNCSTRASALLRSEGSLSVTIGWGFTRTKARQKSGYK